ncbi:MAG: DUF4175 family protein [Bacteroidia bacterium]|nr:hypothetical protein [Bacteroidia bacterium]MDW8157795.1 DUF4175 family protein [Bacteroidia bacterium]
MIRGAIILALLSSSLFVSFVLSEGYFWLSSSTRTFLMAVLAITSALIFALMIAIPFVKYMNLGKTMSDEEAAKIIGKHFAEVDDRLLNLLQLSSMPVANSELLIAAIQTKTEQLRPIPFTKAVNFKPNWRLARYILVPLLLLLLMWLINPEVVTKGSYRLVNYSEHFQPPPPFEIFIPDHRDRVVEGSTYAITVKVDGKEIPAELFIYIKDANDVNFQKYMLEKKNLTHYNFTFRNVRSNFQYYIGNELHGSKVFEVQVLERPAVNTFFVVLNYPAYTGLAPDTLPKNVGDISALPGTIATWHIRTKGPIAKALFKVGENQQIPIQPKESGYLVATRIIKDKEEYQIELISDAQVSNNDTVRYAITPIADKYPVVTIQSPPYQSNLPESGIITLITDLNDDFGFTKAEFHFRFIKSNDPTKVTQQYKAIPLQGIKPGNLLSLTNAIDLVEHNAQQGDEIEYYVKVWDNDFVSGPKSATSVVQKIAYLSTEELYEDFDSTQQELDNTLANTQKEAEELEKKFEKIDDIFLNKKNLDYEDMRQIRDMLKEQKQMLQKMEETKQALQQQVEKAQQNELFSPEVQKKMEQLEKMIEQMTSPELKRLLEELQKNMNDMDKNSLKRQLEQIKMNAETLKQDLERMIELFKQLKVEQKVEETLRKLENLIERQDLLSEKLQDAKKEELPKLQESQKELSNKMEEIKKDLKELQEMKEQTQTPDKEQMQELQQMGNEAQQDMKDAAQEMQQGNKKKAGEEQKKAKQQMQKMQQKLSEMQNESQLKQQKENYEDLRVLLENLLKLSFEQEDLKEIMAKIRNNDPSIKSAIQRQGKIKDDMRMIEDSLVALSKRAFEIQKVVTDELKTIKFSLNRTMEHLGNRQLPLASREQHQIMASLNRLANMLTESLNQMQQQMKMQMHGIGKSCKIPSPGTPTLPQLSKMQQQLNQKMQELMEKMGKGKDQGESPSEKEAMEIYEKLAKEQEAIRKKLKDAIEKMKKEGKPCLGSGDKIAEEMQQTEEDLRKNQQITAEMLARQQRILNRMLDFDKSMREREWDEKRRSTTARERKVASPAELTEEQLKQRVRKEYFNKDKYQYTPTYQELIDQYYKLLDNK